ncbi:MAG: hypothetical protein QOF65_721 [Thermoleophilaceae bacterium]|jgi:hypothetical protein|nr:hypothetical protein [Thermoleophilaceae bacterium]
MRRLRLAATLAALAAAAPATALGGGGGSFIFIGPTGGSRALHAVSGRLEVTGSVTVDFHGDQAAGCEARHLCDVSGTVRWSPAGPGSVFAIGFREHGHSFEQGSLSFGDLSTDEQPLWTSARVRRNGPGGSLCADGAAEQFIETDSPARPGTSIELRLLDLPSRQTTSSQVLRTRCAGPMTGDVAALLPTHRIGERALIRGHRTLDYSADRSFAAHGLAGTVHSTVVIRVVGGEKIPINGGGGRIPATRKQRIRAIDVVYRVERVSGQIATAVRGRGDPDLCGPLDACGISGSVTVTPTTSSGTASLSASAPARHSRRQLRQALGLAPGGTPRGVTRYGDVFWQRDLGDITSELTRLGAPACSDSDPISGGGSVDLEFFGGHVRASYGAGSFSGVNVFRTRCPGPDSGDLRAPLASGTFPLSIFRGRRVTLHLTQGHGFSSAGYTGRSDPDLTVVLRRTRIHEFSYTQEVPTEFSNGNVHSLR